MPVLDEVEMSFLESVDRMLGSMTPSQIGLVLARIHGQSARFSEADDTSWDLFGIWSESSPSARKIICRAMSSRLQGGSYRSELYKAWGDVQPMDEDQLSRLIQRIHTKRV